MYCIGKVLSTFSSLQSLKRWMFGSHCCPESLVISSIKVKLCCIVNPWIGLDHSLILMMFFTSVCICSPPKILWPDSSLNSSQGSSLNEEFVCPQVVGIMAAWGVNVNQFSHAVVSQIHTLRCTHTQMHDITMTTVVLNWATVPVSCS